MRVSAPAQTVRSGLESPGFNRGEEVNKPGTILTVQVLLWIGVGGMVVVGGAATALSLATPSQDVAGMFQGLTRPGLSAFAVVIFAFAALYAVTALKLGAARRWARWAGLGIALFGLSGSATLVFAAPAEDAVGQICGGVAMNAIILGCLLSGTAKRWCDR